MTFHDPERVTLSKLFRCIIVLHDWRLLAVGVATCAIAIFTSFTLLRRASAARQRVKLWLFGAAFVFAAGVWLLNFVAMLAFRPGVALLFNIAPTITADLCAAVVGFLAFWLLYRTPSVGTARIGVGALLCLAICGLHYVSTDAMEFAGRSAWSWSWIAGSIAAGLIFCIVAMLRLGTGVLFLRRVESCAWLTLAVAGVYFLGTTALTIDVTQPGHRLDTPRPFSPASLEVGLACVMVLILVVALAAAALDQHLADRTAKDLGRLRLLSSLSREVLLIHRDGMILEINAAGEKLFGLPLDALLGQPLTNFFRDTPPAIFAPSAQADAPTSVELTAHTATGEAIPVDMSSSIIDYEGRFAHAMALRDLSDRRRSEERIRFLAHHDALTGLPNRSLLTEQLAIAIQAARSRESGFALLYLDLDRFKPVNDQLGHASGDELLRQVAARLRTELRVSDTLARIGGDEFVIVTDADRPREMIAGLADRLIATLCASFDVMGCAIEIGGSIGIALYPQDGVTEDGLLRAADTALYRVKESGRNGFLLYEQGMDAHVLARRALEQDLRSAIDRHQLDLHFQPQVNCRTGVVDGFEALVRWHHPQHGLIPPLELIPLAEQSGQIGKIGAWVLETACAAAAGWPAPRWVGVNMSATQFRDPALARRVAETLARTGLPADRLEIEVNEGVFVEDGPRTAARVGELRGLGVRVSLDDFGGGHCTLNTLRGLSVDKLKIDQSYIRELGQNTEAGIVVRAIVGLGHDLGLQVVAEGVETEHQLALIQGHGCDHAQGFLLGRPTPDPPATWLQPEVTPPPEWQDTAPKRRIPGLVMT